ncbi:MAG: hypothetical protein K0S47_583 [Herbinix sp.]|jgi:hypothetical protein|nr:hypothetical protein [Herbinix sp.]
MEYGASYPKRIEFLSRLIDSKSSKIGEHFLVFQNTPKYYSIYNVPIYLPKYRLANGRTKADQLQHLALNPELPSDFFMNDKENIEAIKVQHELLKKKVEKAPNDRNLLKFFKENSFDEPLILDAKGFVINGNRRLCAIRELYYSDPTSFSHFTHLKAIILPECTEEDLDVLEAQLQIIPDIKEDYSWTNTACKYRDMQVNYGYSDKALADLYQVKETEMRAMLSKLNLGERYLDKYNLSHEYSKIEDDKFAFDQIFTSSGKLKQTEPNYSFLKEALENLSFIAINNKDSLDVGRIYAAVADIYSYHEKIFDEISNEINLDNEMIPTEDSLDDLFGFDTSSVDNTVLLNAIKNSENDTTIAEILKNVINEERAANHSNNLKNAFLKHLQRAQKELEEACSCIKNTTNSTTTNSDQYINQIDEYILELKELLSL